MATLTSTTKKQTATEIQDADKLTPFNAPKYSVTFPRRPKVLPILKELPQWQKQYSNSKIINGYVRETNSLIKCLHTVTYWNNQTVNIILNTVFSTVYFTLLLFFTDLYLIPSSPATTMSDYIMVNFYLFGAFQYFALNSIFYLLESHSLAKCHLWFKLSHLAFINYISTSIITQLYYTFFDNVFYFKFLTISTLLISSIFAIFTLSEQFLRKNRSQRNMISITFIVSLLILPTASLMFKFNTFRILRRVEGKAILLELSLYLFSMTLKAVQVPERFSENFDFIGNSENIYHICIILGSLLHFKMLLNSYFFMHSGLDASNLVTFNV